MQKLVDAVRKAALPAIWSQGVKLSREQSVARVGGAGTTLTLRVRAPGHAVAPTVTLYPEDLEWSCDCGGKADPCAHVVAAVVAASQGQDRGPAAPGAPPSSTAAAPPTSRVVYRFGRRDRMLTLVRVVVDATGREAAVTGPVAMDLSQGRGPLGVVPTHDDVRVARILATQTRDVVPLARVSDIFTALSSGADVTFEGRAMRLSGDRVVPHAVVEDGAGGAIVLRIERAPEVTEVVAMGVARCDDTLRPLGETSLSGEWLERLPVSRTFSRAQQAELVTKVIPDLEQRIDVTVRAASLPRTARDARPRIAMDLTHGGHALSVLPTLVYGDPPIARVEGDALIAVGSAVPVRRRDLEQDMLHRLRDELNLVPGRRVDFDGVEAARFAAKLRAWQERDGDGATAKVFEGRPLHARIEISDDAFDVVFEMEEDEDERSGDERGRRRPRVDAAAVLMAFREGLDVVPVQGGGWAPLPREWLALHGQRVADLLAARDGEKRLPRAALFDLGALCAELDMPKPQALDRLLPLLQGDEGVPSAALPAGLRAELRTYQRRGVDWLSFLRDAELGAVLADDMGLGKTLQTLCALRGRTLVVCPKSVVYNWSDEIARFRPGLRVALYHGSRRTLDRTADVTLTTYAVLRMDAEALSAESWDVIVLDEAQAIKNETSQTARAAFDLKGRFRLALSGTPVENRLEELWSVMRFANPGLLGGRSDFQERYALPIARGDKSAAERLRAKTRPFVLRRMKRDVLPELPPRTDVVLHVELDETERAVYDAVRAAAKRDVVERFAEGASVLLALEALLRLRQAACHPSLVPGQRAPSSSKVERLLESLEDAASEGHKALVFSQWTSLLDLVEPHLQNASIPFLRLDGTTRDRGAVVEAFQEEGGPPVLLVSLKAGGTGLNLTAADHVFLLDPWWNPAVEDQAADRAHRIGQDRPVMVYRLVAKDTVEEGIFALQQRKRALADVALGGADHGGAITRDDILALLE